MKPQQLLLILLALTGVSQAQLKTGSNPETITSTANFEVEATNGNKFAIDKTTGYVGVGTAAPGSSLSVNGSFSGGYISVTSAAYAATASDYTISWSGTASGTVTLPAASTGVLKGRIYMIKNASVANFLSVSAAAGESIGSSSDLSLAVGDAVTVVNTGAASGVTWQVLSRESTASTLGSGSSSSGYDLTTLPSVIYDAAGKFASYDAAENTDSSCDMPSTSMSPLMDALPSGGVIRVKLPAFSVGHNNWPASFDFGLPSAASRVGKSYYFYVDWTISGDVTLGSDQPCYLGYIIPTGTDHIAFTGLKGSSGFQGDGYAFRGSYQTYTSSFNLSNVIVAGRTQGGSVRPMTSPVTKLTATSNGYWLVETGIGVVTNLNP